MRRKWRSKIKEQATISREELAALHGEVWTTAELARTFVVTAIIGSRLIVRRKADGIVGSLAYQEGPPRLYYGFTPQPTG